jgi:hypothetical protein
VADITALRNTGIDDLLDEKEYMLADKGYQGCSFCLSPFKGMY